LNLAQVVGSLYRASEALNRRNIQELIGPGPYSALCDLGCDDGSWTVEVAKSSHVAKSFGVDIARGPTRVAKAKGVSAVIADLARGLPFRDETFDLIHGNQVIEHVADVDHFLREVYRTLRPRGIAVLSTENGSSWHNVLAAVMGWQIFSLTNVSATRMGIGNPLALHRGQIHEMPSWTHRTIFNYLGLLELLRIHGFEVLRVLGSGYYPFPARVGRIDVRHSHFISVKAIKGERANQE
jgi:SAM-dependent methyltransferase